MSYHPTPFRKFNKVVRENPVGRVVLKVKHAQRIWSGWSTNCAPFVLPCVARLPHVASPFTHPTQLLTVHLVVSMTGSCLALGQALQCQLSPI